MSEAADSLVDALVGAALSTPDRFERARVAAALADADPDELPFSGWRALLLLDDVLEPGSPWQVRTDGLRRRNRVATVLAARLAGVLSAGLEERDIAHGCTGELPLAWRARRPGDRPVHGVTVITARRAPIDGILAAATDTGLHCRAFARRRSWLARREGLTVVVHRGWPRAMVGRRHALDLDSAPPSEATAPIVDGSSEARRVRSSQDDEAAQRLDLAILSESTSTDRLSDAET